MSRFKTFYINYNVKRVDILFKNMNIYPNTCSLQGANTEYQFTERNACW